MLSMGTRVSHDRIIDFPYSRLEALRLVTIPLNDNDRVPYSWYLLRAGSTSSA
jgi:hypothetical protein